MWRKWYSEINISKMNITIIFVLHSFLSISIQPWQGLILKTNSSLCCLLDVILRTCCKGQPRVVCDFMFPSLVFHNRQKRSWRTRGGGTEDWSNNIQSRGSGSLTPRNIHLSFPHMLLSNSILLTTDMNDKKCINALLFGCNQYYAPGLLVLLFLQCREGLINEPWEDATRQPQDKDIKACYPVLPLSIFYYTAQQNTVHFGEYRSVPWYNWCLLINQYLLYL